MSGTPTIEAIQRTVRLAHQLQREYHHPAVLRRMEGKFVASSMDQRLRTGWFVCHHDLNFSRQLTAVCLEGQ